jgi:hypothetical protein
MRGYHPIEQSHPLEEDVCDVEAYEELFILRR